MRGFRVGLAVVCLALPAYAEGTAENGQPAPLQVGGWRFGMTKQQAAEVCAKAGGAIEEASSSQLQGGFFCTPVPEAPAALSRPDSLRADLCGTTICELKFFWNRQTKTEAEDIVRALVTKYGPVASNEGTPSLTMLDYECRRDTSYDRSTAYVWLFGIPRKDGARVIAGALLFSAWCDKGGGLTVMTNYRNQDAALRAMKRNTANY